jgi:hypothetical protein
MGDGAPFPDGHGNDLQPSVLILVGSGTAP